MEMIRDQLVCGINDSHIQWHLLAEPDLTYKKAFDLAQAMETAEYCTIDLQDSKQHHNPDEFHYTAAKKPIICYRCGGSHKAPDCQHKDFVHHSCEKKDIWQKSAEAKPRTNCFQAHREA